MRPDKLSASEIEQKLVERPEWSNVYNRVDIHLTTHDSGGITELDFSLAAQIDSVL